VFRGEVVDFISVKHFAVFNLADSAIVCGGILVVLLSFKGVNPDGTVLRDGKAVDPAAEDAPAGDGPATDSSSTGSFSTDGSSTGSPAGDASAEKPEHTA
jgi:signal peptidase II